MRTLRIFVLTLLLVMTLPTIQSQEGDDTPPDSRLSESIITTDEVMTLYYPPGWIALEWQPSGVLLGNDEALFAGDGPVVPEGEQIFLQIAFLPGASFTRMDNSLDLEPIIAQVTGAFALGGVSIFPPPTEIEIGEYPALRAQTVLDLNTVEADAYVLAVDRSDQRAALLITALTVAGEFENFTNLVHAIAESIDINGARLPEVLTDPVITSSDGRFSIPNPSGWFAQREAITNIALATDPALLSVQSFESLSQGDAIIRVNAQPYEFLLQEGMESLEDLVEVAVLSFSETGEAPVNSFDLDGYDAASTLLTIGEGDAQIDLFYLFVDRDDLERIVVLIAVTSAGDMVNFEETAFTIVLNADYADEGE